MNERGANNELSKRKRLVGEQRQTTPVSDSIPYEIYEKAEVQPGSRFRGELEQRNPEINPLPPTPITDAARDRLLLWGMTEEEISTLQKRTSSFRYDLCPQKAQRIAEKGVYQYGQEIIIPDFFSSQLRGDGQCMDIVMQQIRELNMSGYLLGINERLWEEGEKPQISPVMMIGQLRTHFNREGDNHVWSGLILGEGTSLEDTIVVDASFQTITTIDEGGYSFALENTSVDPVENPEFYPSAILSLGEYREDKNGSWDIVGQGKHHILGSSFDGNFIYAFGFAEDNETEEIKPWILARDENIQQVCFYTTDRNGEIVSSDVDDRFTEEHAEEAHAILSALNQTQILEDNTEAGYLRNESQRVFFK